MNTIIIVGKTKCHKIMFYICTENPIPWVLNLSVQKIRWTRWRIVYISLILGLLYRGMNWLCGVCGFCLSFRILILVYISFILGIFCSRNSYNLFSIMLLVYASYAVLSSLSCETRKKARWMSCSTQPLTNYNCNSIQKQNALGAATDLHHIL